MREQHDPVHLIVQVSAIAFLLASVALSLGSLRDISVCPEGGEASRTSVKAPTTPSQVSASSRADSNRPSGSPSQKE